MAKVIVTLDDLDKADGQETRASITRQLVLIDLDSAGQVTSRQAVELDLTAEHSKALDALLAPYLAAGEPIGETPSRPKGPSKRRFNGRALTPETTAMLDWADSQGWAYESKSRNGDDRTYYPEPMKAAWRIHQREMAQRNGGQS